MLHTRNSTIRTRLAQGLLTLLLGLGLMNATLAYADTPEKEDPKVPTTTQEVTFERWVSNTKTDYSSTNHGIPADAKQGESTVYQPSEFYYYLHVKLPKPIVEYENILISDPLDDCLKIANSSGFGTGEYPAFLAVNPNEPSRLTSLAIDGLFLSGMNEYFFKTESLKTNGGATKKFNTAVQFDMKNSKVLPLLSYSGANDLKEFVFMVPVFPHSVTDMLANGYHYKVDSATGKFYFESKSTLTLVEKDGSQTRYTNTSKENFTYPEPSLKVIGSEGSSSDTFLVDPERRDQIYTLRVEAPIPKESYLSWAISDNGGFSKFPAVRLDASPYFEIVDDLTKDSDQIGIVRHTFSQFKDTELTNNGIRWLFNQPGEPRDVSERGKPSKFIGTVTIKLKDGISLEEALPTLNAYYELGDRYNNGQKTEFTPLYSFKSNDLQPTLPPTYSVSYSFVSDSAEYALPDTVLALLPSDDQTYREGTTVTPRTPSETTIKTSEGTWTFKGWNPSEQTIAKANVAFEGTWSFEKQESEKPGPSDNGNDSPNGGSNSSDEASNPSDKGQNSSDKGTSSSVKKSKTPHTGDLPYMELIAFTLILGSAVTAVAVRMRLRKMK